MVLYYNGENIASIVENDYWDTYWGVDESTEIQFIFDDYDEVEQIEELMEELNLDYCNKNDEEEISKILKKKLTTKHLNSYEYVEKSIKEILDKVMLGVVEKHPVILEEFEDCIEEMPVIATVEDLKEYISPLRLFIHEDGNIGIGFDCYWEEEHGLGVLFSIENGVISVGDFSEAF